ncbi:MAG: hypothetical protein ACK5YO_10090, partial [Planctomyces sp.]
MLGCIGTGDRWIAVGPQAMNFSDRAAVCDVDRNHVEKGRETALKKQSKPGAERTVEMFEDYRKLLDRNDIDVVTILTHKHGSRAAQPFHCAPPNLIGLSFFNRTVAEGKTQFIPGTLAR